MKGCTSLSTTPHAPLHSPPLLVHPFTLHSFSYQVYPSLSIPPHSPPPLCMHIHPPYVPSLLPSLPMHHSLLYPSLPHSLTPSLHTFLPFISSPVAPHFLAYLTSPHSSFLTPTSSPLTPHPSLPHPSPLTSSPSSLTSSPITPSPFPFSPSLHRQALPWSSANGCTLPHTLLGFCPPRHFSDCPLPTAPGSLHDLVCPPHLHPPPLRHTSLCCLGYHTLDLHGMN